MLVAVTLLVRFVAAPGLYPDFRMSALSAFFYFSNWRQIAASGNYFVATGAVSPLTHTWSLAVEEQFYLVWPLVVLAVMHLSRTFIRGIRVLLVLSVAGAVASAVEMALLYHPDRQHHPPLLRHRHPRPVDPGRLGAGLLDDHHPDAAGGGGDGPDRRSPLGRSGLVLLGLAGFAGTLSLTYTSAAPRPFDYRGGFLLSALSAAAIIIGAVCVPGGPDRPDPVPPPAGMDRHHLLWRLSLALPGLRLRRLARTGLSVCLCWRVRFGCTFALAAASYYLVERPVIYGTFWRSVTAIVPASARGVGHRGGDRRRDRGTGHGGGAGEALPRCSRPNRSPKTVVVLGDSNALDPRGLALTATAPPGITVADGGLFGCGLALGTSVSNDPPHPDLAMFPGVQPGHPGRPAVAGRGLPSEVAGTGPGDVVMFVAGAWEVTGHPPKRTVDPTSSSRRFQRYEAVPDAQGSGDRHLARGTSRLHHPARPGRWSRLYGRAVLSHDSPGRRLIYDHLLSRGGRRSSPAR